MTPTENTPLENTPMSPELERAMSEIREEIPDAAAIEAAAARVWTKLADTLPGTHLRTCADFQALIPEYRCPYMWLWIAWAAARRAPSCSR